MGTLITYEEYMNRLSERVIDNTRQLKKGVHQRRNGMEDLYGICFSAEGDAGNPASFYISISPDCIYLQRFAFKFVIRPFTTTVTGGTSSATVAVNSRSLSTDGDHITPNPHDHTTSPHTHNVINGISFVQTTSTDWRVRIAGIDITPYLKEQQGIEPTDPLFDMSDGSSEKVFPSRELIEDVANFYDILDVASVMMAEGREEDAERLVSPDFKKVEILSDAPFGVSAYLYTKFSNLNR